ncbi:sigma-70 family RNA polymerase sigma factor [Actinoplanes sp. TBRC 11911]|uniref:RNA polymerase sigma factor n=1 Tax=Actinoplanes sp. TBRC 11911 TaxID=2729386 RepID=UPI00145E8169|nr:sigma-70 family RNA polymerase sigma factor [Actinoplanes sp. TBRC 11911]NMO50439.1 sigma-70 family RNA polymerase sigma factor [Actinoplanes sp. TBRC 11911]
MAATTLLPSDADLTARAQAGDGDALAVLLARHEAGMKAVALRILGRGPDAEDAVQDAILIALRKIGDVRDGVSVGAWLRMIVRNECRARFRPAREIPVLTDPDRVTGDAGPEALIENHALRDWIWAAIEGLSPSLRLTVMLRYFSNVTTYDRIAALCDVPIGTVRSRLAAAKTQMVDLLASNREAAHDDSAALNAERHRDGVELLAAAQRGEFAAVVADRWAPDVRLQGGMGERGGRDMLLWGMDRDLTAGIHQRVTSTVASRDLTIWDNAMTSPSDDPDHCPPAVTWLLTHEQGRVQSLRLFFPVPPRRYMGAPVG